MIELLQFRHSPYNEKVRWALDLKRVPHTRRSLLPGPHVAALKPLTGRTGTPVIRDGSNVIDGSARILDWLETRFPEPKLLPDDPTLREEALAIQRRFDDDLTPRIRCTVIDALLSHPGYFADVFADGRPRWQRSTYALLVPLAAPLIRRANRITGPSSIDDGHAAAREALDLVAVRSRATGYLVGDRFSIADLTAASTLAVLARPAQSSMTAPQPVSAAFAALMARYAAHPAVAWTHRLYAKHRGTTSDFDGLSTR